MGDRPTTGDFDLNIITKHVSEFEANTTITVSSSADFRHIKFRCKILSFEPLAITNAKGEIFPSLNLKPTIFEKERHGLETDLKFEKMMEYSYSLSISDAYDYEDFKEQIYIQHTKKNMVSLNPNIFFVNIYGTDSYYHQMLSPRYIRNSNHCVDVSKDINMAKYTIGNYIGVGNKDLIDAYLKLSKYLFNSMKLE